jgi:hypothetical protein
VRKLWFCMEMRRWVIALAIVLVALNVLDVLTTRAALSVGCVESDGFAVAMFTTFGFALGVLIKLGAATMVGSATIYSYHFDCRAFSTVLAACFVSTVCLYIAVVCNNIINMLQL